MQLTTHTTTLGLPTSNSLCQLSGHSIIVLFAHQKIDW